MSRVSSRSLRLSSALLLTLATISACSSGPEEGSAAPSEAASVSPVKPAAAAAPLLPPIAVPTTKAASVPLALRTSAETPVYVQVAARDTCTLREDHEDSPLRFYANDVGIVHFNLTPTHDGAATAALDCVARDGSSTRYPLELSGTTDEEAISETHARLAVLARTPHGTPRPALTGDPLSYDASDLFARGYGRRPDPKTKPELYAQWLDGAQRAGTIVLQDPVDMHVRNVGISYSTSPSGLGGWSGAVQTNPGGPYSVPGDRFNDVAAEWIVPEAFAESQFGNYSSASTWAGLGGVGSDVPLWQAGAQEFTHSFLWFQTSGYNMWWEVAPNINSQNVSMNVDNGDDVVAEVWVCDPTQSNATTGPGSPNAALCAWLHNYSKNEDWTLPNPQSTASLGATTSFLTAEVIQEWNNGGNNDYAQFDKFAFKNTGNCSTANTWNNCLGAQTHLNPFGYTWAVGPQDSWDGYVTTMDQIGSASHSQGGSCLGDSNGNCNNNGGDSDPLVWVWWNSHE